MDHMPGAAGKTGLSAEEAPEEHKHAMHHGNQEAEYVVGMDLAAVAANVVILGGRIDRFAVDHNAIGTGGDGINAVGVGSELFAVDAHNVIDNAPRAVKLHTERERPILIPVEDRRGIAEYVVLFAAAKVDHVMHGMPYYELDLAGGDAVPYFILLIQGCQVHRINKKPPR